MAEIIRNPHASRKEKYRVYIGKGPHKGNYLCATNKETYAKWILAKKPEIQRRKGAKWYGKLEWSEGQEVRIRSFI